MSRLAITVLVFLMLSAFAVMIVQSHAVGLATIQGTVYWYDQYGNLRPMSWAQVTAVGEDATTTVSSTTEGKYVMWVAPGAYNVTASSGPGYIPDAHQVVVSPGGVGTADFYLKPSGNPVPEYPSALQPVMLVVAALVAMVMIRRRQRVPSTA
jgi:hypothetical protein